MRTSIATCRDCHLYIQDGAVRYGIRHNLHPECAIKRGAEFLLTLKTWQLEALPAMALQRAGLFAAVTKAITARRVQEVYDWADRDRQPAEIARRTGMTRMQVVTLLAKRRMELEEMSRLADAVAVMGGEGARGYRY